MGAVEDAVDAAANFVGPFVDKTGKIGSDSEHVDLVQQALVHLQAINTADLAADPNAPYDASLAGVVYGILDLITTLGILPHLSPGVSFAQRPRSVLTAVFPLPPKRQSDLLAGTIEILIPILEQKGSGVQPLLSQRILPDLVSALAELSFSPTAYNHHDTFLPVYNKLIESVHTWRLLPILTTFLQQPLPTWLRPLLSKQLAMMPLREQGVRHTIEFLSLSYLNKNSNVPHDASDVQSQIPLPLEAVTQAARLLVLPPTGVTQDKWLSQLAPQLWSLLDGDKGVDLSRAAGQIIAGGILSKRATGAPDTVGWRLFAEPLLQTISPKSATDDLPQSPAKNSVLAQEQDLEIALKRLYAIVLSYSHVGLLRRLIGPILLSAWALLNYAHARPALNKKWGLYAESIISRYMAIACDPVQIDKIAMNIFWDGDLTWTFGPGSHGGIEIRRRNVDDHNIFALNNALTRIGSLDSRTGLLVSLLAGSQAPEGVIASIFLQITKRWLSPSLKNKPSLTNDEESDPFSALIDAKMSEAIIAKFKDQLARNPHHIIDLMGQIVANFVGEHQGKVQKLGDFKNSLRDNLRNISKIECKDQKKQMSENDTVDEEVITFAISILSTLVTSPGFEHTPVARTTLAAVIPLLVYLSDAKLETPLSPIITNSANNLLRLLQPSVASADALNVDPVAGYRTELKKTLAELTSPDPPDRTWALGNLRKIIQDPIAFTVIDVPSTIHLVLSASLADPESYVHIAALPVLVDLAIRAPDLVVKILTDAFTDVDERSLQLVGRSQTEEKDREIQDALDFRLRVGEVLSSFIIDDSMQYGPALQYRNVKQISEACLTLSSRRGQRTQTMSTRTQLARMEQDLQDEGEAAWGGPIPSLLDPEGENSEDQAERDSLLKIVHAWEHTGVEEDVRIRASALSVLSAAFEHRLTFLRQTTVDATLQMVLLIVTMETSEGKSILRRAAVLVVMDLLRGLDSMLEVGEEGAVGFSISQQEEVAGVVKWVRDEDVDALVRDHAANVLEGLETWRFKKLYKLREEGIGLSVDLGLEGSLRGLAVRPEKSSSGGTARKLVLEELD
jgi:hypothetical protein